MKSPFSQLSSFTASKPDFSFPCWFTIAWCTSGYWVEEWFPQIITFFTWSEGTPTRIATYRHGGTPQVSEGLLCAICANNELSKISSLSWSMSYSRYVTRYGCSRTKLDVDDGQYIAWLPAALESTKIELETSIKQNEKWRWMRRWGSDLRAGPVMVQTGQAGEVLLRNGGSRFGGDQTVGVGWVSDN